MPPTGDPHLAFVAIVQQLQGVEVVARIGFNVGREASRHKSCEQRQNGFVGREEGIAAMAVTSVDFPSTNNKSSNGSQGPRFYGKFGESFWICLSLLVVTLFLYWPATNFNFILMDDGAYVYRNPWVKSGLSWDSIGWAFTSTHAANWHPLTWVSLILDYSMYGLFAGGYHLTNLVLHSFNTVLLFLVLKRMTGRLWPSALVAALFGWHPLHVESVAWVAERKDVLSFSFMLLTILVYLSHVKRPAFFKYASALILFALALMSKPMVVTLPCLLILLDYWPLKRVPPWHAKSDAGQERRIYLNLVVEKLPFFALSAVACVLTVMAQNSGGAVKSIQEVPFSLRALNAVVSYAMYLCKTVWPQNLSVYYPLRSQVSIFSATCAGLVLSGISYLSIRTRSKYPWIIVGWLWFLGTLVPVIGLIQVGKQAMADRYTYIPSIGLFVMVVWTFANWLQTRPSVRIPGLGITSVVLLACLALTREQLSFWRNSITLFTHAVSVTRNNATADNNLGIALSDAGRNREALFYYREALRIAPNDVKAHYNIGIELASEGNFAEAEHHFSEAIKFNPQSEKLHNNLGVALAQQGKLVPAMDQFKRAIELNPIYPNPYLNLGEAFQAQGLDAEAFTNYVNALNLKPDWDVPMIKLAFLAATCRGTSWYDPAKAIKLSLRANEITSYEMPSYLEVLALSYATAGQFSNAVITAEWARTNAVKTGSTQLAKSLDQELEFYRAGKRPHMERTNSFALGSQD